MSAQTMKGYLDHVEIRGFRSLKDVSVDLSPLTVLIGANGSGKSNFIKFFELMRWLMDGRSLREWVAREAGADDQLFMGRTVTEKLLWQVSMQANDSLNRYQYEAVALATGADQMAFASEHCRYIRADKQNSVNDWVDLHAHADYSQLLFAAQNDKLPIRDKMTAKVLLHLLRRCHVYHFHDTSRYANLKKHHDVTDSVYLNADGGNLAALLLSLKENEFPYFQLIEHQIKRVLPAFDGFLLEPEYGKVMLRWRHKDSEKIMGAHLTSDGSLRLFCLITLFNLPDERLPDVILLDEPELGLHPYAIQLLAAMMKSVSKRTQIIASTQSVTLANELSWQDIVVVQYENNASRLVRLDEQQLKPWLENYAIGDIWQKNLIGGTPVC